jgi:hypothetical protein
VAPDCEWNDDISSFSLDSRKLCWFIVEDLMFANPNTHEHLLLLVLAKHENFSMTWLPIYIEQKQLRPPISFDRMMFFQIEAVVVKNVKQQGFVDGVVTIKEIKCLLTTE